MYTSASSQTLSSSPSNMSVYGKSQREESRASLPGSFIRWVQLKNYQYEVTFSLYMLTQREKVIFNSVLLGLVSMMFIAAFLYLPNHISIIYNRVWYYVEGSSVSTFADAVKTTRAALSLHTTAAVVQKTTERVLTEL